jgi:putative tryptophan/tyrosine transport system substrate-binding protein
LASCKEKRPEAPVRLNGRDFSTGANDAVVTRTRHEQPAAARALGLQIQVHNAGTIDEIDTAFATLARERPDALVVSPDPLFLARRVQLVLLAAGNKIPTAYGVRNYVEAGGLASYGASFTDAARQVGIYTGQILKGTKPGELPIEQATKFDLVLNLRTARTLGITFPPALLIRADEVIE